ncbi:MAG: hypothetical protein IT353_03035 [Gemmatimonadaceae bacterium]|nr:hypothetical protein [Gemmatimonadaceae bacterium]
MVSLMRAMWSVACATASVLTLMACADESPVSVPPEVIAAAPAARAFGIWTPTGSDTCAPDVHNRYATVGPDGKKYPTWHPPVDPLTGCSFGHEHGRDPRGSNLYASVGDLPFGYANERLDAANLGMQRHEDHVGHKVEWENNVRIRLAGNAGASIEVTCDVLVKLHQGTHSKDAFTNNLHELMYHLRCSDRTELHVTIMSAIGRPGEFVSSCGGTIQAGVASPPNAPAGGGHRRIPDASCLVSRMLVGAGQTSDFGALHESWETSNELRTADGKQLAAFDPYFQVFRPSRYFDAAVTGFVGRPVALCATTINERRARGSECNGLSTTAADGSLLSIPYDDTRSGFNGVRRQVDINNNILRNAGGPTTWYTDPFGKNARREPFPGSIQQFVSAVNNDYGVGVNGPVIGGDRNYGGTGVRAPN